MSDRFKLYAGALTAIAVMVALGGAIAETLQPKDRTPQHPNKAPRFLYIHCAAGDNEPCGLDPAMQRLNGDPRLDGPKEMPAPAPLVRPDIAPAR